MKDSNQLDTSIAANVAVPKAPDMVGNLANMMQIKSLATKIPLEQVQLDEAKLAHQDNLDTRQAFTDNTAPDPATGAPTVNVAGTLSSLMDKNPRAAYDLQLKINENKIKQAQAAKENFANQQQHLTATGSIAGSVLAMGTQEGYDWGKQQAASMGVDVSAFPAKYEEAKPMLTQFRDAAMSTHDQIQTHIEQAKLNQVVSNETQINSNKIRDQYQADPGTVEYRRVQNAALQGFTSWKLSSEGYAKGLGKGEQGVYDMGLITAAIKMDNPTIAPTQGQMMSLEGHSGIMATMIKQYNGLLTGDTLAPAQRDSIKAFMTQRMEDSRLQQARIDGGYQSTMIKQGLNPEWAGLDSGGMVSSSINSPNPFLQSKDLKTDATSKMPDVSAPKAVSLQNADGETAPAPKANYKPIEYSRVVALATANKIPIEQAEANIVKNGGTIIGKGK